MAELARSLLYIHSHSVASCCTRSTVSNTCKSSHSWRTVRLLRSTYAFCVGLPDSRKEEIAWLEVVFGLLVSIERSLIGCLAERYAIIEVRILIIFGFAMISWGQSKNPTGIFLSTSNR